MEKDTVIVSVDNISIKKIREDNFYATPKTFLKEIKFIAFYESSPVSGITCYAEIDKLEKVGDDEINFLYRLRNFPEANPPYTKMSLKNIKNFKEMIKKDNKRVIQGPVYANLKRLLTIKKLSEL
ncbi:hypothetical protein HN876_03640 [archaeon]|nr:hypothetical protein [archaeon]